MSEHKFDGSTYDHERDSARLSIQFLRVFSLMEDGKSRTLDDISQITGDPTASISARLRDMRKPRFGSHKVTREYLGDGLYSYTLSVNDGVQNVG